MPDMQTLLNVINSTKASEGDTSATNANTDGQGLSWGELQWSQRSGSLGVVVAACRNADPAAFAQVFGSSGDSLVAQLTSSNENTRMAPVGGAVLWAEPWLSRFKKAGTMAVFKNTQTMIAASGSHMATALAVWARVGVKTERVLALMFDTAVNQGEGAIQTVLSRFLASWTAGKTYNDILNAWCYAAASRYRSDTPRDGWQAGDDGRWYKIQFGRRVYDRILERQRKIAADPVLSNQVIS